ncbi:MAG TPA: hypothetical protein DCS97_01280 [Planctomycetes bacterium]|nr:hypothetical protein [Planctomycetota bacterium]
MIHAHPPAPDWSRRLLYAAPVCAGAAWGVAWWLLKGAPAAERDVLAALAAMLAGGIPLAVAWWWRQIARLRSRRHPRPGELPARTARRLDEDRRLRYGIMGAYQAHLLLFLLPFIVFSCAKRLGPPGGGGGIVGAQPQEEQVEVVKVLRKKMIVNPFSAIKLKKPNEVDIDIKEQTQRLATAQQAGGDGQGSGGYEGGEGSELNFVILDHGAAGWDEAVSAAAPNLLRELRTRLSVPTARRPVTVTLGDLMAQKDDAQQPSLIYLCLARNPPKLGEREVEWLRRYLVELHGLLLLDDTGGGRGHAESLARRVMPGRPLVAIPNDDALWRIRQPMREPDRALARHGGDRVLGVREGQRWSIVYHPGDLVDGWRGAYGPQWQEIAYQFGSNVFDYATRQFTRRLRSQTAPP